MLDEPFSGLDPLAVDTVLGVLRERAAAGVAGAVLQPPARPGRAALRRPGDHRRRHDPGGRRPRSELRAAVRAAAVRARGRRRRRLAARPARRDARRPRRPARRLRPRRRRRRPGRAARRPGPRAGARVRARSAPRSPRSSGRSSSDHVRRRQAGRRPRDPGQAARQDLPLQHGVLPAHRDRVDACCRRCSTAARPRSRSPTSAAVSALQRARPGGPDGRRRRRRRAAGARRRRRRRGGRRPARCSRWRRHPDDVVRGAEHRAAGAAAGTRATSTRSLAFLVPFALGDSSSSSPRSPFGLQIAQSVTEEKQTRIVEILVASVPVRALLAGKVAAMTAAGVRPDRADRAGRARRHADRRHGPRLLGAGRAGDRLVPAVLRPRLRDAGHAVGRGRRAGRPAGGPRPAPRCRCRWW